MQKYNFFQKYQIKFTTFSKLYMRFFYNFFQKSHILFTTFSNFQTLFLQLFLFSAAKIRVLFLLHVASTWSPTSD